MVQPKMAYSVTTHLPALAQVDTHSGEVHWHASIKEEWKTLYIISDEDETGEAETTTDDPEDEEGEQIEAENNNTDEEEEVPDHRRDENNEY